MAEVDELLGVIGAIEHAAKEAERLRVRRAELIDKLRAAGWSLQRIADAVGRSKQTIDQWTRH
jgi:IS30 family transposase